MAIPIRLKNPPETFPGGTIFLIVINTLIFALTQSGGRIQKHVLDQHGLVPSNLEPFDFLASMFLHGDFMHLLGNMWFLYIFGFAVEGRLKTYKFLPLYLFFGFCGDLLHLAIFGNALHDIPTIGASGAIMGCMGAALYLFPHAPVDFWWRFGFTGTIVTVKMMWVGAYYIGIDLLTAIVCGGGGGVANLAHVGGAVGGVLAMLLLRQKPENEFASEAKATLYEDKDFSTLDKRELAALYGSHPRNAEIAMHWMDRSLTDPYGVKPEAAHAFATELPEIVRLKPEAVAVAANVMCHMSLSGMAVPPPLMLRAAQVMEQFGKPDLALRLYECSLKQNPSPEDIQAAIYRGALICENVLFNFPRAAHAYLHLVQTYPMGPFSELAKGRRDALIRTGRVDP